MASEVVAYMLMLAIGVSVFGFFSSSFNTYYTSTNNLTLETNLSIVVKNVGSQVMKLIHAGEANIVQTSGNITAKTVLDIDSVINGETYGLDFTVDALGQGLLETTLSGTVIATYSIGIVNGTVPSQIFFSGSISSASVAPSLLYTYNALTQVETISLVPN